MRPKRGATFGPWTLTEQLGEGGNARVWLAINATGDSAAVKILFGKQSKQLNRFKTEAEAHGKLRDVSGILPIVGQAYIPEQQTEDDPAWFAMARAEPLSQALKDRGFSDLVRHAREIAETLCELARRGFAHRDIKPSNLYIYNDRGAIGDLGLITYPGKSAATGTGEHVGSRGYIPPEMMNGNVEDQKPGDVYTLAKSIWVLATKQNWPPQGQIRVNAQGHRIEDFVSAPRVARLDALIQRATDDSPQSRPTMDQFAKELGFIERDPIRGEEPADLSDLQEEIRARELPEVQRGEQKRLLRDAFQAAVAEFQKAFETRTGFIRDAVERMVAVDGQEYFPSRAWQGTSADRKTSTIHRIGYARSSFGVTLFIGAQFALMDDDSVIVDFGGHVLTAQNTSVADLFDRRVFTAGTAEADHILRQCIEIIVQNGRQYVQTYLENFQR